MIARRAAMLTGMALLAGRASAAPAEALAQLEQRHGGRLGVAILDTARGKLITHRGGERFPLCSTYKALAAAFVLARVDRGEESLGRQVKYGKEDVVTYSPATLPHAGADGLTVAALCEAAVTLSDNTAGNLLLDSFGGPTALTTYLRSLGDTVSRLDRRETALNEAAPGDPRDTTTPEAMLGILRQTVTGTALSPTSRDRLASWLEGSKTGAQRLQAGVPTGWRAGDKTGSGANNVTNDVAIIWPPGRGPIIVTAFYIGAEAGDAQRNAVLADVGRLAVEAAG